MSIQDIGAVGEFLGLFAILITLFYLAKQTRQSVELSRGKETRALVDTFNEHVRRMTEPENLRATRKALVSYRAIDSDLQARAYVILTQWVNFYEQCSFAFDAGLLPSASLAAIENYTIGFLITAGGAEYWEDFRNTFGADVSRRLDRILSGSAPLPEPITSTYPWLLLAEG